MASKPRMDIARSYSSGIFPHLTRVKDNLELISASYTSATQDPCDIDSTLGTVIGHFDLVLSYSMSFGSLYGDEFLVDVDTSVAQFLGEAQFLLTYYQAHKLKPKRTLAFRMVYFSHSFSAWFREYQLATENRCQGTIPDFVSPPTNRVVVH